MTKSPSPESFSTNHELASNELDDDHALSSHDHHVAQLDGDGAPTDSDPTGCNTTQTTTCPLA